MRVPATLPSVIPEPEDPAAPLVTTDNERAATGVPGLDAILMGGLPRNWVYLVLGEPGTGKTTLGLSFLLEGLRLGESVLYVTLAHSNDELVAIARSHGWSIDGVPVHEVSAGAVAGLIANEQTVLHPADVELPEMTEALFEVLARTRPNRVVFDAVEQLQLMTDSTLRYRRQVLSLKQALSEIPSTSLFLMDGPRSAGERDLEGLVHGVIELERHNRDFGGVARRLMVSKGRGMQYMDGFHAFRIRPGGLEVFPRVSSGTAAAVTHELGIAKSGLENLDTLLGGGLERGTACLVVGSTGTGKTTLTTQYVHAAASRGERAAVFLFDESVATYTQRSISLDLDVREFIESGHVTLDQFSTGELSPGEFAHRVREKVELGTSMIVIDSLTGYFNAMAQEGLLINQMHELLSYLGQRGVLTFLIMARGGLDEGGAIVPVDISYLADSTILLSHFNDEGHASLAIAVLKKRHGPHERAPRELIISGTGLAVGTPHEGRIDSHSTVSTDDDRTPGSLESGPVDDADHP